MIRSNLICIQEDGLEAYINNKQIKKHTSVSLVAQAD